MSKGIIVVGGTEEEHYNLLGKDRLQAHPINQGENSLIL